MSATTSAQQILGALRLSAGDALPERYWELVERYRGELLNQALAMLGSHADAEDVVQESFLSAFRNPAKLAEAHSLGAWLRTLNRANALKRLRDKRNVQAGTDRKQREAPGRQFTTGGFSTLELREIISKAIETLPADLRVVMVLRYWEHLSCDEVAARLKLPPGTVRWMVWEATQALHGQLGSLLHAPRVAPAPPGVAENREREDEKGVDA